jgi:hypothetical protein
VRTLGVHVRGRVAAFGVVMSCLMLLISVPAAASAGLKDQLLNVRNLPTGWIINDNIASGKFPCAAPASTVALVGRRGVGASYVYSAAASLLVEYLVQSTSLLPIYEGARNSLRSDRSCKTVSAGVTFTSSTNDGKIHVPPFGQWSAAMKFSNYSSGVHSQLGCLFARKGTYLVIVAYENPGKLDVKTLENFAQRALAKLN